VSYNPLEVGGPDDYPIKVGSCLLTMVDPNPGFEKAYNRWYERDHYYGGCLIGPWLFAGSRWVAPRALRSRRWPADETIARPYDAGAYVAIYWVERGHHKDHFDDWAVPQVRRLYAEGRGFLERRHIHTVMFDHLADVYRDPDPVPVALALDARYDGIVLAWFDGRGGRRAADVHEATAGLVRDAIAGSVIESASTWTPSPGQDRTVEVPMDLGSLPGGPERTLQMFFVRGAVESALDPLRAYTDAVDKEGIADTRLVAPFVATVVGTDRYVDQL
jgi:hypothetical protein